MRIALIYTLEEMLRAYSSSKDKTREEWMIWETASIHKRIAYVGVEEKWCLGNVYEVVDDYADEPDVDRMTLKRANGREFNMPKMFVKEFIEDKVKANALGEFLNA